VDVWLLAFLTWALDGSEWSASRSDRFTQGKKTPILIGWEVCWALEAVWAQ